MCFLGLNADHVVRSCSLGKFVERLVNPQALELVNEPYCQIVDLETRDDVHEDSIWSRHGFVSRPDSADLFRALYRPQLGI